MKTVLKNDRSAPPLSVAFARCDKVLHFWVFGRLHAPDVRPLEEAFFDIMDHTADCPGLIVNLSYLESVDHRGMGAIRRLVRFAQLSRTVVGVCDRFTNPWSEEGGSHSHPPGGIPWFSSLSEAVASIQDQTSVVATV